MFNKCLICTDFTDNLQRLVDFVPSLAKSGLKEIVFFHNVSLWEEGEIPRIDQEKVEEAIAKLAKAKSSAVAGIEVKIEVTSGRILDNIVKTAQKYHSEVILVGTSLKNILEEKLFGSITLELTKKTSIPVMILRPQLIATYTVEELSLRCEHLWRYFLIPYKNETADHYLIEKIKEYLTKNSKKSLEKCFLLSVIDDAGRGIPLEYKVQEISQKLVQIKSELQTLGLETMTEVLAGNPLKEVLNTALIYDISCVTIAFNSNNFLESMIGNLGTEILQNSWFPILFFPFKK